MTDIHSIIAGHNSKSLNNSTPAIDDQSRKIKAPSVSEIPDIFFDKIIVEYKLTRIDIMVLMGLYRSVWCRPNLHKAFGISPIFSYKELSKGFQITIDELYQSLRKLEQWGFIETIRSGQYFVRKYFTRENDEKFGQTYNDFEM